MKFSNTLVLATSYSILLGNPVFAATEATRLTELEAKVEALTATLESQTSANNAVSIGGYGELHYNNLAEEDSDKKKSVDFHRFVLFFGYEFSNNIHFISEFELEHALAGDGKPGEVELEQAYIEFDNGNNAVTQGGVFLVPVGILNETHEPPTFYGVERNDVESIIIPSTWWEAGVQHIRRFGEGWQWNIALHSGLAIPTEGSNRFRIRSGRQKVAKANASSLAYTTRIKYTGIAGLEWAASLHIQDDSSQTNSDGLDDGTLFETHVIYNTGNFGIKALYADWDFNGNAVEASDADSQTGFYIEPSYKINDKIGIYVRTSDVDAASDSDKFDQAEIGFNWWPHEDIVVKADYRTRSHDLTSQSDNDFDGFDIGIGYQF